MTTDGAKRLFKNLLSVEGSNALQPVHMCHTASGDMKAELRRFLKQYQKSISQKIKREQTKTKIEMC